MTRGGTTASPYDAHPTRSGPLGPDASPRLWALCAALLLALLPFSSYNALLGLIREGWVLTNVQANAIFSAYLIGYALSALLLVPLSDRMPTRRLWLGGLGIMWTGHLLFVVASSVAQPIPPAALARSLAGAGHALVLTTGVKIVANLYPARRGAAVGTFVAAGFMGTTASFVLTGLLLRRVADWQAAYGLTTLIALGAFPFALAGVRNMVIPDAATHPGGTRPTGRLDLSLVRTPSIRQAIVAYAWHTADLYVARLWLPLFLAALYLQQGLAAVDATARGATVAGGMFMLSAPLVFAGGWLADRWGRIQCALFFSTASVLCSLTIGWLLESNMLVVLGVGLIYALVTAADSSIYSIMLIEAAPPDRVGAVQALQAFIGFGIGALWPIVAGQTLDWTAPLWGWRGAFTVNGLAVSLGVWALVRLYRSRQLR